MVQAASEARMETDSTLSESDPSSEDDMQWAVVEFSTKRIQCAGRGMLARLCAMRRRVMASVDGLRILYDMLDEIMLESLERANERFLTDRQATKVQKCWRGHLGRLAGKRQAEMILKCVREASNAFLTSVISASIDTIMEIHLQHFAAAQLQSRLRCSRAVQKLDELWELYEKENVAAILIQAIARGHFARKKVLFWDTPKYNQAAVDVQRVYRGALGRRLAEQEKINREKRGEAAVVIQTEARCWFARRAFESRQKDVEWPPSFKFCSEMALLLQSSWRGHYSRATLTSLMLTKLLCQKIGKHVLEDRSAQTLQNAWRMNLARKAKANVDRVRYANLFERIRGKRGYGATVMVSCLKSAGKHNRWSSMISRIIEMRIRPKAAKRSGPHSKNLAESETELCSDDEQELDSGEDLINPLHRQKANLLCKVFRGFLARKHISRVWKFRFTPGLGHLRPSRAAAVLQRTWRRAKARRDVLEHTALKLVKQSEASNKVGGIARVLLHNTQRSDLRCVRQSDRCVIIIPGYGESFLEARVDSKFDIWRAYRILDFTLVKIIILACKLQHYVEVSSYQRRNTILVVPGLEMRRKVAQPPKKAVTAKESKQTDFRTRHKLAQRDKIGIVFQYPAQKDGAQAWVIGQSQTIRWKTWAHELGLPVVVDTVLLSVRKVLCSNASVDDSKNPHDIAIEQRGDDGLAPSETHNKIDSKNIDIPLVKTRSAGQFIWSISAQSAVDTKKDFHEIMQSSNYKEGVWDRHPEEPIGTYEQRRLRQRLLREPGGQPLTAAEISTFMEPEYELHLQIIALRSDSTIRVAPPQLNLKPAVSAPFFLISSQTVSIAQSPVCTHNTIEIIFPCGKDFTWHQGDVQIIRWRGARTDTALTISLHWNEGGKEMKQILYERVFAVGAMSHCMPRGRLLGDGFRICISTAQGLCKGMSSPFTIASYRKDLPVNSIQSRQRWQNDSAENAERLNMVEITRIYANRKKSKDRVDLQLVRTDGSPTPIPSSIRQALQPRWNSSTDVLLPVLGSPAAAALDFEDKSGIHRYAHWNVAPEESHEVVSDVTLFEYSKQKAHKERWDQIANEEQEENKELQAIFAMSSQKLPSAVQTRSSSATMQRPSNPARTEAWAILEEKFFDRSVNLSSTGEAWLPINNCILAKGIDETKLDQNLPKIKNIASEVDKGRVGHNRQIQRAYNPHGIRDDHSQNSKYVDLHSSNLYQRESQALSQKVENSSRAADDVEQGQISILQGSRPNDRTSEATTVKPRMRRLSFTGTSDRTDKTVFLVGAFGGKIRSKVKAAHDIKLKLFADAQEYGFQKFISHRDAMLAKQLEFLPAVPGSKLSTSRTSIPFDMAWVPVADNDLQLRQSLSAEEFDEVLLERGLPADSDMPVPITGSNSRCSRIDFHPSMAIDDHVDPRKAARALESRRKRAFLAKSQRDLHSTAATT